MAGRSSSSTWPAQTKGLRPRPRPLPVPRHRHLQPRHGTLQPSWTSASPAGIVVVSSSRHLNGYLGVL
eukprot:2383663-Heterocapsa_arctica.AAC.1